MIGGIETFLIASCSLGTLISTTSSHPEMMLIANKYTDPEGSIY